MEDNTERDEDGEYTGRLAPDARKRKHAKWPWVLLVILILAAAAVAVFFWQRSNRPTEEPVAQGKGSYTELISSYLESASANDETAVLKLFFPHSDAYYQNSENSLSTLEILIQEDDWTANYGIQVQGAELADANFADLNGEQASTVANVIAEQAGFSQINELYTVEASVTYANGGAVQMTFEIVQCESGCYLVAVQQ